MDWFVTHFAAIVFYTLAAIAVLGAVGVLGFRSPVYAALSLLATFLAVAGLFVLQHAELIAAVQVFVYAGGVIVLFLFVIMLVNVRMLPREPQYLNRLVPAAVAVAILLAVLLGIGLFPLALRTPANPAPLQQVAGQTLGNTEAVGWRLYRDFLLPFEVVSLVLLVAMIGAIVMGRKPTGNGGDV